MLVVTSNPFGVNNGYSKAGSNKHVFFSFFPKKFSSIIKKSESQTLSNT